MVPMEVVATTEPLALVERIAFGILVMAKEVEVANPRVELAAEIFPVVVKLPTTVEDDCERNPTENVCSPVHVLAPRPRALEPRQIPLILKQPEVILIPPLL